MKVYIGPYRSRIICRIFDRYMDRKYGDNKWPENSDMTMFEHWLEGFTDGITWIYDQSINRIIKTEGQTVKIKIDSWDTWSADYTLSYIVLPLLIQYKATHHGGPNVADADVPENLRRPEEFKDRPWEVDDHWHDRWDWVLDEMIFAFQMLNEDDDEKMFDKETGDRVQNGFRLFGVYFQALWD